MVKYGQNMKYFEYICWKIIEIEIILCRSKLFLEPYMNTVLYKDKIILLCTRANSYHCGNGCTKIMNSTDPNSEKLYESILYQRKMSKVQVLSLRRKPEQVRSPWTLCMIAWNHSIKASHSTQNKSLYLSLHYFTLHYVHCTLHSIVWYADSCTWSYTTAHIQRRRSTVARSPGSAWMPVCAWMGLQLLMKELVHCSRPRVASSVLLAPHIGCRVTGCR